MFAYCYGIFMFFIVFNDDDLMGCFKGHVPMLHVPLLHHRGDRPLPHQHHQQSGQSLIHFKQVFRKEHGSLRSFIKIEIIPSALVVLCENLKSNTHTFPLCV